jgi:hypothetical protein
MEKRTRLCHEYPRGRKQISSEHHEHAEVCLHRATLKLQPDSPLIISLEIPPMAAFCKHAFRFKAQIAHISRLRHGFD